MHLSPEEIAAAEACGVSFLPASDAQVQRLAMQRKVFYRSGAPILATRGDGLFETVGTLQQLIDEGRQQQRDLSQWLEAAEPAVAVPEALPEALPETLREALRETLPGMAPEAAPEPEAASVALLPPAALPEPAAPPPKRQRQKRRRPDVAAPELAIPAEAAAEPEPEPEPEPEAGAEAEVVAKSSQDPEVAAELVDLEGAALPPALSRSPGRTAARAPAAAVEAPGQDRGKRWLMAGAARRGRAGKHWSTRQR